MMRADPPVSKEVETVARTIQGEHRQMLLKKQIEADKKRKRDQMAKKRKAAFQQCDAITVFGIQMTHWKKDKEAGQADKAR